jgi:dTDP-4-amino-4,6-dideoxygalactose transaminase
LDYIAINKPLIGDRELKAAEEVLASGMLTDASYEGGKKVREFEGKVKALLGAKHVVAVNSGTAALHTTLLALGVGKGDEVVVPSFTFAATANVVLACGAKPVFVDTRKDYNMDPSEVRRAITKKTRVIVPVHVYGYPADMQEINEVASSKGIRVMEDAAESLGAEYKGKQSGTLSDAGCFSLYASKVITSGEGGAICTNDDELAHNLRLSRNAGMLHGYDTRHLGLNYRLPEVLAAVASVQMDRLGDFLRSRARNVSILEEKIGEAEGWKFTQKSPDRTHVYYLYTLTLRKNRDKVQKSLNRAGVGAGVYWRTPVHKTPLYKDLGYAKKRLRVTEHSAGHVISLPVHPGLGEPEMERVGNAFLAAARNLL